MDRQRRIDGADGAAHVRQQRVGAHWRSHDELHRIERGDRVEQVDLGNGRAAETVVAHVADDAFDLEARAVGAAELAESADWILAAPVARRRRLVQDDVQRIFAGVGLGEEPSATQRNPRRSKVSGVDDHVAGALDGFRFDRMAFSNDRRRQAAAGERQPVRNAGVDDAGNRAHGLDQPLLRCEARGIVGRRRVGDRDRERQQVIGLESGRDAREAPQIEDQRAADREQRERQRDLGDDQRLREPANACAGRRADAGAQDLDRRGPRRLPERRDAADDARDDRHSRCERDAGPVQGHLVGARDEVSADRDRRAHEPDAHDDAGRGAGDRDQETLGEVLDRELPLRDAEGDARRRLARPRHRPRQQQAGDVGAGDQQKQTGGEEEQQQRRPNLADEPFAQVEDPRGVRRMRRRVERGDLGGDARDVGLRLRERHARLSPRVAEVVERVGVRARAGRIEKEPDVGVEALAAGTRDR